MEINIDEKDFSALHCDRYHFEDVAASNKAVENGSWEVRGLEQLSQSELSMQECSSAWLLSGAQLVSKFNEEVHL